jgi:hypothetical protein
MVARRACVLSFIVLLSLSGSVVTESHAQTRFAVEAGGLLPSGGMGDTIEESLWFGARMEIQKVNALGQVASGSILIRAGYSDLSVKKDAAEGASASYFDVGLGARVYSTAIPFFLSAAGSYARYDPVGTNSKNGFTPSIGAGLALSLGNLFIEGEGRINFALVEDIDNVQFWTLTGALGLPF